MSPVPALRLIRQALPPRTPDPWSGTRLSWAASQMPSSVVQQLETLLNNRSTPWLQRLVVRNEERIDLVPVESIDWIESANNYTVLHCGEKTHILGETLTGLEQRLAPQSFLRVHRRLVVNLSRLVSLYPVLGGVYELELSSGVRLTTGRQYREGIQKLISNSSAN
jgi:two-component system LytT family response regulator